MYDINGHIHTMSQLGCVRACLHLIWGWEINQYTN